MKRRLHLQHDRNKTVVALAKMRAKQRDPALPCEVCDFSFVRTYGERGEQYIEGHHRRPIATLKEGAQTRAEDIALVCSNCHRMLHRDERLLSVEELREIVAVFRRDFRI
ncbi:MAG: HNH endonuclease [Chloroflexi bacterium]|nr:HNH endonuclease [Chloroflexota bacterium]